MSASKEFVEYILDLLEPIEGIRISRMFGGVLLKVGKRQLGVLFGEKLYFKITNPTLQEKYKSKGSIQFSYVRKDKKDPVIIKNWWTVPEDAMEDSDQLVELTREVLAQKDE